MGRIIDNPNQIPDVPFYVIYPSSRNLKVKITHLSFDRTGRPHGTGAVVETFTAGYRIGHHSNTWVLGPNTLSVLYETIESHQVHDNLKIKDLV